MVSTKYAPPSSTTPAPPATPASPQPPKLLDQVRNKIRFKHYSFRTEQTYIQWIRRFILFHNKQHPSGMGAREVEAFLTHLAVVGKGRPPPRIRRAAPCCSSTRK